ncbi:MAG: nicotinate-nucleotide adenylyltransferase [Candidatus Hydrothermia bacterium]|jgi:nicotinate-nucleotide adenylyltransferase
MQKIGIFGGAFDPIHIGHLILAQDILENVKLDRIMFLVNYQPPHKEVYCSFEDRYNMVKLATSSYDYFTASDFERAEMIIPSYTFNVMVKLKEKLPDTDFYLIIGADQYNALEKWYRYKDLLQIVKLIILKRPGFNVNVRNEGQIIFVDERLIDISSTEIRERIKNGKSIKHFVPEKVEEYITEKGLYL